MPRKHVHHDTECENVSSHNEYEKDHAGDAEEATAPQTGAILRCKIGKQNLARVGHREHFGVSKLELADHEARVGRYESERGQEDQTPSSRSLVKIIPAQGKV